MYPPKNIPCAFCGRPSPYGYWCGPLCYATWMQKNNGTDHPQSIEDRLPVVHYAE